MTALEQRINSEDKVSKFSIIYINDKYETSSVSTGGI